MATIQNLMAFGMAPALARRIASPPFSVTVGGGSVGSATGMIGHNGVAYVVASNSGSGMVLPSMGGEVSNTAGMLGGDSLQVINLLSASVVVYAPGTMTFTGDGASTAGSVGISVAANRAALFTLLTTSTYAVLKGLSA